MIEQSSFEKLVGTTLGPLDTSGGYRLEKLIEKSEQGPVFLTSSNRSRMRLRILAIPADLKPEARMLYLGRFQQQANQVAGLQQTYILPLLDYGNHQGMPYLVSPDLSAIPLSAILGQRGPFDALTASRYLDQVATALEYAHEHGVLHRNLTTDGIFLKQDGNLVVADFGLLRMLELAQAETGQDGRTYYSVSSAPAPEQILGKPIDTYTDVYALGAVLYRMLTAHRVFRGTSRDEIISQHLQAPIPSVQVWRKDLPAQVDGVIARAMAKEPAQRFQHPGELANAYHQVVAPGDVARKSFVIAPTPSIQQPQNTVGPGVAPGGVGPLVGARAPRQDGQTVISRRRMLTLIGAGGGAAVAIAAVALFANHYLAGTTSPPGTLGSTGTQTGNPPAQANNPPASSGHVLAHTSDIPLNSAKTFPIAGSQNPGILIHLQNNQFVAFNSTCTHAGCPVSYNAQSKQLDCPCHGAVFDPARNAAVVTGPAPTPLAAIPISVHPDGTITEP